MVVRKMRNTEPSEILPVEDVSEDARLPEEALKENRVHNTLYHVADGMEVTRVLGREEHSGVPSPDLVLLDRNLPRKDGREVPAEGKGARIFVRSLWWSRRRLKQSEI